MATDPRDTPAMRQFYRFKERHPGCVLLFRMGDFYETFDDDAVTLHNALGLTLTRRSEGLPMAGVPFHQLENYLRKLVAQGFRVAVCDQIQDPKEAKGIVERAVTRVITAGTRVDETLLADDESCALAAVVFLDDGDGAESRVAAAVADASTGEFRVFECRASTLGDELARRAVRELIHAEVVGASPPPRIARISGPLGLATSPQPGWYFRAAEAREALLAQFGVATLAGFGLRDDDELILPAGALVRYLRATATPASHDATAARAAGQDHQHLVSGALTHLRPPRRDDPSGYLHVDAVSWRALEIERTIRSGRTDGSLLGVFMSGDYRTPPRTAMGKRLLRDWLCRPLCGAEDIGRRQDAVAVLLEDRRLAEELGGAAGLGGVQDVPRIAARLSLRRASPRDLVALGRSAGRARTLAELVRDAPALAAWRSRLDSCVASLDPFAERLARQCVDDPPPHLREGGLFRPGVDAELDDARGLRDHAGQWLAAYQRRLADEHSLPNLKVGYNKVFGYYIELPAAQARQAPAAFVRKQTLTNAERYITPELKAFEDKASSAEARALDREQKLFAALCAAATTLLDPLLGFAEAVAELDALLCFADKAHKRSWRRPEISTEPTLVAHHARHPVLDELLGSAFVPNDIELGARTDGAADATEPGPRLALITGPNMAGKSTYIRTAALLTLLAHTGSFVPADRATIGLTDRIFTRIGADDALHAGQSTFMVEMIETAGILLHATPRSLVILDEIGRGTSTLDGLSLAWAIAERLAGGDGNSPTAPTPPRTLFATHYHELTDLDQLLPGRVRNLHVTVREWGDSIVFLHRIEPGRASQSYGIQVARLAGLPDPVVRRAREILDSLAVHHHADLAVPGPAEPNVPRRAGSPAASNRLPDLNGQLALFTEYLSHPAVDALRELKIESLTPLRAFDELRRLAGLARASNACAPTDSTGS
ncbi:MAG: DNA mismatch repair protein MutS [Phycisphaerae bacterium]|nr:DNA mismatch repair protein MutS [Phycisphaerae bacterium]